MKKPAIPLSIFAVLIWTSAALAEERKLNNAEIEGVLSGHLFKARDKDKPAEQIFHGNGATYYNAGGNQSQGVWRVSGDQYCSQWPPSDHWTCYDLLQDGNLVVFVSSTGTRYPMLLAD